MTEREFNLRKKHTLLLNLARDQAGQPEGQTATRMAEDLMRKIQAEFPGSTGQGQPGQGVGEPSNEILRCISIRVDYLWEVSMLIHAASTVSHVELRAGQVEREFDLSGRDYKVLIVLARFYRYMAQSKVLMDHLRDMDTKNSPMHGNKGSVENFAMLCMAETLRVLHPEKASANFITGKNELPTDLTIQAKARLVLMEAKKYVTDLFLENAMQLACETLSEHLPCRPTTRDHEIRVP